MTKNSQEKFKLEITEAAFRQAKLILENDFTLKNSKLRLSIDGKECHGFTYALGFTQPTDKDILIELNTDQGEIELLMDPFVAHYCYAGKIDYIFDPENDLEGFQFHNENEKKYRGKFFKKESMAPDPQSL